MKFATIPLLALVLSVLGPVAQGQAPAPAIATDRNTPEERLESMHEMMKIYGISRETDASATFKLQTDPAFRIGRQSGNLLDGAVFLFMDETSD